MRPSLVGPAVSSAALAVWIVLASRNPNLTYHFAPLIVGGAWAVVVSGSGRSVAAAAAGGGTLLALAGTVGLAVADKLRGPDLVGGDAATAEAVVFAALGGLAGYVWSVRSAAADHATGNSS